MGESMMILTPSKVYCGKVKNFTPFASKRGAFLIIKGNEWMEHGLGEYVIFARNNDVEELGEKYTLGTEVMVYAPEEWKPKSSMGGVIYNVICDIRMPSVSMLDIVQDLDTGAIIDKCPKCEAESTIVKKEDTTDGPKYYSICSKGHFFATYRG